MNLAQLRETISNDPEKRRRLVSAFLSWNRPRRVLCELNERRPKYWYWDLYWYRGWDIPEEYVNRILEEDDIRI